jgi:3-deoxy-7-phosphoheptulonate synthase
MRFFFEKPRSSIGWKGFLHDPFLKNIPNIKTGIIKTRSLMLKLTDMEIPLASEILDPLSLNYFKDLITWGFIGSRTSSSQIHRQIASSLIFPVGLKNPIDGNIKTAVNSLISAKSPHSYLNISNLGKIFSFTSLGNLYSHIVLRGSYKKANSDFSSIKLFFEKMKKKKVFSPIVIDCAHDNSKKSVELQKKCFKSVLIKASKNKDILGIMMESYIKEGNQKINFKKPIIPNISITDPCIGLEDTKKLILFAEKSLF